MNDPNDIFKNERGAGTSLTTFELVEPFSGYISSSGEIIDNAGAFMPNVVAGSTAQISGYLSTIPPYPGEMNMVAVAQRNTSVQWVAIPLPIDGV